MLSPYGMDLQVRNAANIVVQPEYGDDGMDPVAMEGKKGEPVALQQKLAIVKAMSPKEHSSELAPLPAAFKAAVAQELAALDKMPASNGALQFCSQAFRSSLEMFLLEKVISDQCCPFVFSKGSKRVHSLSIFQIFHAHCHSEL